MFLQEACSPPIFVISHLGRVTNGTDDNDVKASGCAATLSPERLQSADPIPLQPVTIGDTFRLTYIRTEVCTGAAAFHSAAPRAPARPAPPAPPAAPPAPRLAGLGSPGSAPR